MGNKLWVTFYPAQTHTGKKGLGRESRALLADCFPVVECSVPGNLPQQRTSMGLGHKWGICSGLSDCLLEWLLQPAQVTCRGWLRVHATAPGSSQPCNWDPRDSELVCWEQLGFWKHTVSDKEKGIWHPPLSINKRYITGYISVFCGPSLSTKVISIMIIAVNIHYTLYMP